MKRMYTNSALICSYESIQEFLIYLEKNQKTEACLKTSAESEKKHALINFRFDISESEITNFKAYKGIQKIYQSGKFDIKADFFSDSNLPQNKHPMLSLRSAVLILILHLIRPTSASSSLLAFHQSQHST